MANQAKSPLERAGSVPRPALHTFYSGSPKLKLIIFFTRRICRTRKTFPEAEQTLTVFPSVRLDWTISFHLASNDQAQRPIGPTLKVNADGGGNLTPVTLVTGHPCLNMANAKKDNVSNFPPLISFLSRLFWAQTFSIRSVSNLCVFYALQENLFWREKCGAGKLYNFVIGFIGAKHFNFLDFGFCAAGE